MELYATLLLSRLSAYLAVLAGYVAAFQGIRGVSRSFGKQFHRTSRDGHREPMADCVHVAIADRNSLLQ
jgi:hypothetical protein